MTKENTQFYLHRTTSELTQQHLLRTLLSKNEDLDYDKLKKAVEFAMNAHKDQIRKSGVPYSEHPIEVSKLLASLKLDTNTVIAGLLHDVVEDTKYTTQNISDLFGEEVAFMVESVTKITTAEKNDKLEQTAATYRKLMAAMAQDPRIIVIKLADRVHNMRTLQYMSAAKCKRIAQETLDVYAPLTYRFGLYKLKVELEDLSFKYLRPDKYREITTLLHSSKKQREHYISNIVNSVQMRLNLNQDRPAVVKGRPKHMYSIWKKMETRKCSFEELFDIFAIRIIVEELEDCYLVLGSIHNLYMPLQSRVKDYIGSPKPNMYQSLHTAVIGPENHTIEIQIRTKEMDEIAERGIAAHWSYKQETMSKNQLSWINSLVEHQNQIKDTNEYMDFLKIDLKLQDMTVFTPKGKSINLPIGATVLDFAFAVHTDLGYQCIGAKINNEYCAPERTLSYGQTISIIRSPEQIPSIDWLSMVITHRAKSAIRKWHRSSITRQAIDLGKELYKREIRILQIPVDDQPKIETVCHHFAIKDFNDFYQSIGRGELPLTLLNQYLQEFTPETSRGKNKTSMFNFRKGVEDYVLVSTENNLITKFANCCLPNPGDEIVGYLVKGQGIEVHKKDCNNLSKYSEDSKIPVKWQEDHTYEHELKLLIESDLRVEIQARILGELAAQHTKIVRVSVVTSKDITRNRMHLKIHNISQIEIILKALKEIKGIRKVKRL